MSAFYLKGVSPSHVTLNQIFAGMMPYMVVIILCMVIMYVWPGMITMQRMIDRKSTRLNSSHLVISYAVFCLKKKKKSYLTCPTPMYRPSADRMENTAGFSIKLRLGIADSSYLFSSVNPIYLNYLPHYAV